MNPTETENTTVNKAGIRQSLITAKSFLDTAKLIHGDGFSEGTHLYSFYLLIANALELLPKIYIWTQSEKLGDRDALKKEVKKFGHDLKKLYKENPVLMEVANIKDIYLSGNVQDLVSLYEIFLKNNKSVFITDSETSRFGMFSNNPNVFFPAYNTSELLEITEKLNRYVESCVTKLFV